MSMPGNGDGPFYGRTGSNGLQYTEAYTYVFQSANWVLNLLLGMVCQMFIPIVGPIAFLGYEYELIEALHRDPRRLYPDFDFNRFVEYLKRGIWPFLVTLVLAFVMVPLIFIGLFVFIGLMAVGGEQNAGIFAVLGFLLMFVAIIFLQFVMAIITTPLLLRAGLMQDFGAAFNVSFIVDFISRMWVEQVLSFLFLLASSFVVGIGGMLLCFVGVYPAAVLILMAQTHIAYQLYELYLQRGGQRIPLKTDALIPPAP